MINFFIAEVSLPIIDGNAFFSLLFIDIAEFFIPASFVQT